MLAAPRLVLADVAVVEQRRELRIDDQHDVAAVAAVAAGGPAARDELLPPQRHGAVAAVAGLHVDANLVDELHLGPLQTRTPRTVLARGAVVSIVRPLPISASCQRAAHPELVEGTAERYASGTMETTRRSPRARLYFTVPSMSANSV